MVDPRIHSRFTDLWYCLRVWGAQDCVWGAQDWLRLSQFDGRARQAKPCVRVGGNGAALKAMSLRGVARRCLAVWSHPEELPPASRAVRT
jgi:hypothetical protein